MKTLKYSTIFLLIISLAVQEACARPQAPLQHPEQQSAEHSGLKILSWNIYMLPAIVVRPGRRSRAYDIVEQLQQADYNIIVFQEAFMPAARRIIKKGLEGVYPYFYGPVNDAGASLKANGGVWVLSKIKLDLKQSIQFRDCKGIDCMARKGAMLLEGEYGGKKFQIVGTHLQADDATAVREKQMDQIYTELLAKYKEDSVPQIICGDLNTEKEMQEHYQSMLGRLDAKNGVLDGVVKCTYDGVNNEIARSQGGKKRVILDYILLRANGAKLKAISRRVSVMKKGGKYLSDHYGMVCDLKF